VVLWLVSFGVFRVGCAPVLWMRVRKGGVLEKDRRLKKEGLRRARCRIL
jgi:hypothetical protein